MSNIQFLFVTLAFLAVVILIESVYLMWESHGSPEALRLRRRLASASGEAIHPQESRLYKARRLSGVDFLDALLRHVPGSASLDRLLQQAGISFNLARLLGLCLLLFFAIIPLAIALHITPVASLCVAAVFAGLPMIHVLRRRAQRLSRIGAQLPDALDLLARALRAGYAFPAGLMMVASESPEPIASLFREACDEINFGLPVPEALRNLIDRAPIIDLRYFVTSVLIQRESGGNLAEVLGNIASLIRARMKLLGQIRVFATEGKLSAWILTLLPFVVAGAMSVVNPAMIGVLWNDPIGLRLVYGALALMAVGIFAMWRIIQIRV